MILNFLRFRFRDEVDEATKARALDVLRRTASSDAVAYSVIGQDLGDPAAGYTHSYCVAIPDVAALDRYLRQPAHREGDQFFLPLLSKLARSASSDDMDPALRETIRALAKKVLLDDAEWSALFAAIPDLKLG